MIFVIVVYLPWQLVVLEGSKPLGQVQVMSPAAFIHIPPPVQGSSAGVQAIPAATSMAQYKIQVLDNCYTECPG